MQSQQVGLELCLLTERAAVFVSGVSSKADSLAHALQRVLLTLQVNESFSMLMHLEVRVFFKDFVM
jgi:hypothetical protein